MPPERSRVHVTTLALLPVLALSWFDNGHMLVGEIAKQQLVQADVEILDGILAGWNTDFPGMSDIVTAAVWPDLIKCPKTVSFCAKDPVDNIHLFDNWHFDDIPYDPENLPLPPQAALWANDPSGTYVLRGATMTFATTQTRFAFNLLLRFAIHIIGDLHQPLHVVEGYFKDKQFGQLADGDMGGNGIHVTSPCGSRNLHMYWDAGACNYLTSWPPREAGRSALAANATALIKKYPKDAPVFEGRYRGLQDLSSCWAAASGKTNSHDHGAALCDAAFLRWVNDTYAIASNDVYKGVKAGAPISSEYADRALELTQQQLVLGGYRLADLLHLVATRARSVLPPEAVTTRLAEETFLLRSSDEWTAIAKVLLTTTVFFAVTSVILLVKLLSVMGKHRVVPSAGLLRSHFSEEPVHGARLSGVEETQFIGLS